MVEAVWCGVDEMIFAFNLEGEVLFVVCAPVQESWKGAAACLLLAPVVFPIGTDAIPVLKPAPSRPQTLHTADLCAILTGLIRQERSRISSDEAAESSEDLNNHQQLGAEGRGDA